MIHGIDTPGGEVALQRIKRADKAGYQFAIVKASQNDWEEEGFGEALTAIKATDMIAGSFHFLEHAKRVTGQAFEASASPTAQANKYLDIIDDRNGGHDDHLLCLDVENWVRTKVNKHGRSVITWRSHPTLEDVDEWVERFRTRLPGHYLLIYTSPSVWGDFGNPKFHKRYDNKVRLWLAQWINRPDFTLRLGGLKPTIHQYGQIKLPPTAEHKNVDGDASWLTRNELAHIANSPTAPPPPPPLELEEDVSYDSDCAGGHAGHGIDDPDGDPQISISDGIYDANARQMTFEIYVEPPAQVDVSCTYTTHDGTAEAGVDYVAATAVPVTIPAGQDFVALSIEVLHRSRTTDLAFTVTVGGAVGAPIDDDTGIMDIPLKPPKDDDADFISWPSRITVYDQFAFEPGGNAMCTAFSVAATMSLFEYQRNDEKRKFDAPRLFLDTYGSYTHPSIGLATYSTLKRARDFGVWTADGEVKRKIDGFKGFWDGGKGHGQLIRNIKHHIRKHGAVLAEMIIYSTGTGTSTCNTGSTDWNDLRQRPPAHYIIPDPGDTRSSGGHSWILIGWDDNIAGTGKGGFLVQHSAGGDWYDHGRGWLLYKTISMHKARYNGAICPTNNRQTSGVWNHFFYAKR